MATRAGLCDLERRGLPMGEATADYDQFMKDEYPDGQV